MEELLQDERELGKKEGKKRANSLSKILLENGRLDDLRRSLSDEEFQEELFQEYNI